MKRPPIAIDGRGALLYRGTGIGTYTWQLCSHLEREHRDEAAILLPGREYEGFRFRAAADENTEKDRWRRLFLPRWLREAKTALYHVPQNGIGLPETKVCRETVTIHDLIPYIYPETVGKGYLKEFLREMPRIMERCDGIITVSRRSRRDIIDLFGFPAEKIAVIYEAPEPLYHPVPKAEAKGFLKERYGIDGNFLLYVGGFGPRKNLRALITAFSLLKKEGVFRGLLVLPGRRNRETDGLDSLAEALGVREDIRFTDHVPTGELPCFYSAAEAMIYPSFYEGFGLPPLEAMACGAPVVAAKTSSLPEVLGDAALWCDPYNAVDIAEKARLLLSDGTLREELRQKGLRRAAGFSWEKATAETVTFWRSVIASAP